MGGFGAAAEGRSDGGPRGAGFSASLQPLGACTVSRPPPLRLSSSEALLDSQKGKGLLGYVCGGTVLVSAS